MTTNGDKGKVETKTMEEFLENLRWLLLQEKSLSKGTIIITTHQQADPDAIGAMMGMECLIKEILKEESNIILALDDASVISNQIMNYLKITVHSKDTLKFSNVSLLIVVDANNLEICPIAAQVLREKDEISFIIIDHHEYSDDVAEKATLYLHSSTCGSTSEMIATLLYINEYKINKTVAIALTCGILYDSGFLTRASSRLFAVLSYLCDVHPDVYSLSRNLLQVQMGSSEKIARIKAAQRMRRRMLNDLILLFTHVSSHESSAARALLSLGADLVVVVAQRKEETRVSIRASSYFKERTGVNIAKDLLPWLLNHFEGSGGGHSKAAGLNLVSGVTLEVIMQKILEFLEQIVSVGQKGDKNT